MRIIPAAFPEDTATVRALFRAYLEGLGIDLGFQGIEAELADLPGRYAPPLGTVLLARAAQGPALGVVAMGPLAPGIAEMKRLYVSPAGRGRGLGQALVAAIIAAARAAGYRHMRLDTLDTLTPALAIYARMGFRPIGNYNASPLPGIRHFELTL